MQKIASYTCHGLEVTRSFYFLRCYCHAVFLLDSVITQRYFPVQFHCNSIVLFTNKFSYLHYNTIERGLEAFSGNSAVSARYYLASTFKYIVMKMQKGYLRNRLCALVRFHYNTIVLYNASVVHLSYTAPL